MREMHDDDAFAEQRRNFSRYDKKKRKLGTPPLTSASKKKKAGKTCTCKFMCLAKKDAQFAPSTVAEKEMLVEAGLGEKIIKLEESSDLKEIHKAMIEAFPKLRDGGGFELLRALPSTRRLEPLSPVISKTIKLIKCVLGNSRIYVRPIQKDLDLHFSDDKSNMDDEVWSLVCQLIM